MASQNSTTNQPRINFHTLATVFRCFHFLKPYLWLTVGSYLGLLTINLLKIVSPQLIRWIIDKGIGGKDLNLLTWAILGLLGLTVLKGVATFLEGRWTEVASQHVAFDARNAIQSKLTDLSFSYHDRVQAGQLLSRTIQDVDRIRFLTGRAIVRIIDSIILLIGTAVILIWMNPQLGLLSILAMPILVYRAVQFGGKVRYLAVRIQNQLALLTTRIEQNLRGARVVKAFAQEDREIARFNEANETWFDLSTQTNRIESVNLPMLDLIANIGTVAILWYGGWLVIHQQLTLGELVSFTTYLGQLVFPIRNLGSVIPAVAIASAAADRVFEILDSTSDVKDAPGAVPMPPVRGDVRFENVTFTYSKRGHVLEKINFEAPAGSVVALVGPTGSGKTTIVNLIPRFYDPTSGKITIDGQDIRNYTLHSLRNQVGIVLQETSLFATTVRANIAFGRPDASEEEVVTAAKAAQAHEFILEMPKGYDTILGEKGVNLSGGQKQRLAIARVILMDPRILILDDATSSVDTGTEFLIQQAFDQLMVGRTTFVIAHRLSTVYKADIILVLDKGKIVAQGKHGELMRTSPLYAEICERQLKPEDDAADALQRQRMEGR
ncbi:MAG TPA: ABC transporter ATP-binding protein [Anaerolineaceae bacterium]